MLIDKNGNPDVCRAEFSPIAERNKARIEHVKLTTNLIIEQTNQLMHASIDQETKRLCALAKTHYEIAAMVLVKALTSLGNQDEP